MGLRIELETVETSVDPRHTRHTRLPVYVPPSPHSARPESTGQRELSEGLSPGNASLHSWNDQQQCLSTLRIRLQAEMPRSW